MAHGTGGGRVGGPDLVQELWHPIRALLRRPTAQT